MPNVIWVVVSNVIFIFLVTSNGVVITDFATKKKLYLLYTSGRAIRGATVLL
jgi:hypothetical protein